jgi:hypothetical protein
MKARAMMSRQLRLTQLPLVGALLLCLLGGIYLVASKRFAKPASSVKIKKHSVKKQSEDTLKYWTADKMRSAKPANLPNVTNLEREKQQPRRPPA